MGQNYSDLGIIIIINLLLPIWIQPQDSNKVSFCFQKYELPEQLWVCRPLGLMRRAWSSSSRSHSGTDDGTGDSGVFAAPPPDFDRSVIFIPTRGQIMPTTLLLSTRGSKILTRTSPDNCDVTIFVEHLIWKRPCNFFLRWDLLTENLYNPILLLQSKGCQFFLVLHFSFKRHS